MKIEVRSAPHRKIAVADITKNPHRNLERNPISPERVDQLLESIERTGFWDNIVVREHPTREGKYELAYGHNRLEALKSNGVDVDTITIPVARLSNWDMYCAMVDENELQGKVTPKLAMETVETGCELIERALKKVGPEGSWEEFNDVIGRNLVVPAGTTKTWGDHGFEQVRNAFFEGEGLGRGFLADFLPGGRVRKDAISTITAARYAESREAAKRAQAKRKEAEAKEKERLAKEAGEREERERLEAEAAAARAEQKKLEEAAGRIGKGAISEEVLLMFDAVRTMTDFAQAIRKLGIGPKHHKAAAKHIIAAKVKEERIERELDLWWDEKSGAAASRREQAKRKDDLERFKKAVGGVDSVDYCVKIAEDLKDIEPRIKKVTQHVHTFGLRERKIIRERIGAFGDLIDALLERERETLSEVRDITPDTKMLSHRKG
jgi:hypothetical protein